MTPCFADTSYFLALLVPSDVNHEAARAWAEEHRTPIITSEYVLVELGNYLAPLSTRQLFVRFVQTLRTDRRIKLITGSSELLERGIEMYRVRPDKGWSLTDCISCAIMQAEGLRDALTADHHFAQMGFNVLLR